MGPVYTNMPVTAIGGAAALGSANLGSAAQAMSVGGDVDFEPPAAAVDRFLAVAPPPAPFMGFLNVLAWREFFAGRVGRVDRKPAVSPKAGEPGPGWDALTRLALRALRGDVSVKAEIEAVAHVGYLAEMMLAVEHAAGLISKFDRNKAYARLKGIEMQFRQYRRDPAEASRRSKIDILECGAGFHFSGASLELRDVDVDDAMLDKLYDLNQLHFFFHVVSDLFEPYLISKGPRLFGHFLAPDTWDGYGEGMCHPATILAVHLGRQIGLPLAGYFSEEHSSVAVFISDGFLYEPLHRENCVIPKNAYVELHLAVPGVESIPDFSLLMSPIAIEQNGRGTSCLRNVLDGEPSIMLGQAHRAARWNAQKGGEIARQFVSLFYRSPRACVFIAKALIKAGDYRGAMQYLEEARDGFWEALRVLGRQSYFRKLAFCHASMATCLSKLTGDRQAVIEELSRAHDMARRGGMKAYATLLRLSRDAEARYLSE